MQLKKQIYSDKFPTHIITFSNPIRFPNHLIVLHSDIKIKIYDKVKMGTNIGLGDRSYIARLIRSLSREKQNETL